MKTKVLFLTAALGTLATTACSSGRDVEVSGEVQAPATAQGDILLSFYELSGEGEKAERRLVHDVKLAMPGKFSETVPIEGDALIVAALADSNGDGKCTEGEAWGEVEATIENDQVADLEVVLDVKSCPGE